MAYSDTVHDTAVVLIADSSESSLAYRVLPAVPAWFC
jgi:hypothetical protein